MHEERCTRCVRKVTRFFCAGHRPFRPNGLGGGGTLSFKARCLRHSAPSAWGVRIAVYCLWVRNLHKRKKDLAYPGWTVLETFFLIWWFCIHLVSCKICKKNAWRYWSLVSAIAAGGTKKKWEILSSLSSRIVRHVCQRRIWVIFVSPNEIIISVCDLAGFWAPSAIMVIIWRPALITTFNRI